MELKPAVNEQIYFSKKIYLDSKDYLLPIADKYDFSLGLLLAQDAIELLLGAIVLQFDLQIKEKAALHDYYEKIESHLDDKIPYRKEMEILNRARVDIKHHGIYKRFEDYKHELSYLPYFFDELTEKAFNLKFVDVSLASMIGNEKIKVKILDAERTLRAGKYRECAEKIAWARHDIIGYRFIAGGPLHEAFGLSPKDKTKVVYENLSDTANSMLLLQFGIDSAKFKYYSSLLPEVFYSWNKKKYELNWYSGYSHEKNWTEQLLQNTLDYFIELAVKVSQKSVYKGLIGDSEYFEYSIKPKGERLDFYEYSSVRSPVEHLFTPQIVYTLQKDQVLKSRRISPTREKYDEYIVVSDIFDNGAAKFFGADAEISRTEYKMGRTEFLSGLTDTERK